MAKGLPRSMSRGAPQRQEIIKQVFRVVNVPITVAGATGVGFGTAIIGDFPQGNILLLGAVAYLQVDSAGGQAGLVDTWNGDFAVGTTPTADATVTGTDADVIPLTATIIAVAEDAPRARAVSSATIGGSIFDNTDDSLELNFNLIIDDADISANGIALTITGELILAYIVMGDD